MNKLILLLYIIFIGQTSFALDLEKLKTFYAGVESIEATIQQKKSAKYLSMPLESTVHFVKDAKGRILWEVVAPFQSKIEILDGKIVGIADLKQAKHNDKLVNIVKIIEALTTANIAELEKSFDLKLQDQVLSASPKESNKDFKYIPPITKRTYDD